MSAPTAHLCRKRECFQGAGRTGLCTGHLQDTLNRYSLPELIDMAVDVLESRGFPEPAEPAAPSASEGTADPMLN